MKTFICDVAFDQGYQDYVAFVAQGGERRQCKFVGEAAKAYDDGWHRATFDSFYKDMTDEATPITA